MKKCRIRNYKRIIKKELNLVVIGQEFDDRKNLHVLCNRRFDNSYVVWTAYHADQEKNSYEGFYNGKYDMSLEEGVKELEKRRDNYREESQEKHGSELAESRIPQKKHNASFELDR